MITSVSKQDISLLTWSV